MKNMKKFVDFSLRFILVAGALIIHVESRKPDGRSTVPPKMGWRRGNGPCICKAMTTPSKPHLWGPHPSGPYPSRPHPSGPHPSRPHPSGSHPSRPHPSRPHPSRPHPSGSHPSRPYPSGSHPSRPHPSRPHPSRLHPSGPHSPRPHPSGPHSPRPHPSRPHPSRLHPSGPHPSRPHPSRQDYTSCVCRKRAERNCILRFRMLKNPWQKELADKRTPDYKRMYDTVVKEICEPLNITKDYIRDVNFTKGSIVAQMEVVYTSWSSNNGSDPEKALRNAIQSGQLSALQIEPESLMVSQSFTGVKLSAWTTKPDECSSKCHGHKHNGNVQQTRDCTEETASCEDIPLTRVTTCSEGCPKYSRAKEASKQQILVIASVLIVGVVIIVGVVVITKCKRARHKHISTSPSISSMKQLTDDDKLQTQC